MTAVTAKPIKQSKCEMSSPTLENMVAYPHVISEISFMTYRCLSSKSELTYEEKNDAQLVDRQEKFKATAAFSAFFKHAFSKSISLHGQKLSRRRKITYRKERFVELIQLSVPEANSGFICIHDYDARLFFPQGLLVFHGDSVSVAVLIGELKLDTLGI